MSELSLGAEPRTVLGKKVKLLRRAGRVPGVVYGPVVDGTVQVSVDRREFERFYYAHGHSTLFTLRWEGGERPVFIREVQEDPIRRVALHIDFFAPDLLKPVRAMVRLAFHHHNPLAEGVLSEVKTEIEVEALPSDIPHQLDADLSHLVAVGDSLRVADLKLPATVTVVTAADDVLAHLAAASLEAPAEVKAPEEEAEAAADAGEEAASEQSAEQS